MTTIKDIAKATGFSTSTVSRALSGVGYCHEDTQKAILKAAKDLNFNPSSAARTLRNKRTHRILFVIPDIMNPFYFEMIRGTTETLEANGYYAMLCHSKGLLSEEEKYITLLNEHFGDGMILVSFDFNAANTAAIRNSPYPITLTNLNPFLAPDDLIDTVYVDQTLAMYMATEHLLSKGHRHIAAVVGTLNNQTSRERAAGFVQCMKDHGIAEAEASLIFGDYTLASGERAGEEILSKRPEVTAIVSANDLMTMGLLSQFSARIRSIPPQFAIVSLDDTYYARAVQPQLTSVSMQQYKIGVQAASMLLARIQNPEKAAESIRLTPTLIPRASTEAW